MGRKPHLHLRIGRADAYNERMLNNVKQPTMKTATIGARVSDDIKNAVKQLAGLSGQSVSTITEDALREYMGWRVPQILDLKEAIAAADRGEFASDDEADAFFARYGA